jgi:hypothetical protein
MDFLTLSTCRRLLRQPRLILLEFPAGLHYDADALAGGGRH